MTEEPFVLCDNLVKIYKVAGLEVVALQGLDLAVPKGELLGIVGASGSGKSTLMNILGGLDRPSAGRVWVGGQSLLELSDAAMTQYRRTKVGFVWQQGARNLIPFLSALENVELPMTLAGVPARETRSRAEDLLEAVGLSDRQHHYLAHLSGGEQQRVAITVALANQPSLLLADEPTGELDTTNAATIYKTFQDLNQQFNITTLIVSHDQGISRHVNRVVAIRDGKTSSETVRVESPRNNTQSGEEGHPDDHPVEMYEELVVLDSAGRLQVPKEYLEKFSIKGRARLEMTEQGILILPAQNSALGETAQLIAAQRAAAPRTKGLTKLLNRWRADRETREKKS
jgi:ABC-type lipoprotein export system ATPase subunit/bifunctional DNA-binding transcriptional regulator/antitoxin component of YhaV-PrlF toxin-antitoxin module